MNKEIPLSEILANEEFLFFVMHINLIATDVEKLFDALNFYHERNDDETENSFNVLWKTGMYYTLIKFLAFNSEFKRKGHLIPDVEFNQYANKLLSGVMKKWPDLNDYRNETVAHEFRNKDRISIFARDTRKYLIPTTATDYIELANIMRVINTFLSENYRMYYILFENQKLLTNKEDRELSPESFGE